MAKYQANLGRIAHRRGDLDTALLQLEEAAASAAALTARHLQTQIDLWLGELYATRGERIAAFEALSRAEDRLADSQYGQLVQRAKELRARLGSHQ